MLILGQYVPMQRYREDMGRLENNISELTLKFIRAQSDIRKLSAAIDIPERVTKYTENVYHFRGPVEINSTPDGVTVVLLEEKKGE